MDEQEIADWMFEELTTHKEQYTLTDGDGFPLYHLRKLAEAARQQIAPHLSAAELELLAREMVEGAREDGSL